MLNPLLKFHHILGDASPETDYSGLNTLATFEAGAGPILDMLYIVARVVDDNSFEGLENVEVSVAHTNFVDMTITDDQVVFTIADGEGLFSRFNHTPAK